MHLNPKRRHAAKRCLDYVIHQHEEYTGQRGETLFRYRGLECSRFLVENCVYNKSVKMIDKKFVYMTHEDFIEDLTRFFRTYIQRENEPSG